MGDTDSVAHDPSAPAGHLPGFAREEQGQLLRKSLFETRIGTQIASTRRPHLDGRDAPWTALVCARVVLGHLDVNPVS